MNDLLKYRKCGCGNQAEQVIKVIDEHGVIIRPVRVGWYCPACRAMEKAIGRERTVR